MKKSIFTLALITFVTGTMLTSCSSSAEKVDAAKADIETAQHDLDKAKEDYNEQYAKFKLESDQKITANEQLIADLKEYSKNKKKEAKITYDKAVSDLEETNEAMKAKVRDYKEEGNDKWESFKREFNHDMEELGQSITDLTKNNVK
ncbi:hypothetical protein BH10BAC1_BH10BAC1_02360 [soil metagenome]